MILTHANLFENILDSKNLLISGTTILLNSQKTVFHWETFIIFKINLDMKAPPQCGPVITARLLLIVPSITLFID